LANKEYTFSKAYVVGSSMLDV